MQTVWLLISLMFFCLAGCGSRGDLYLPDSTTQQTSKMVNPDISWEYRILGKSQCVSFVDSPKSIAIAMVTGESSKMAAEIFLKTA